MLVRASFKRCAVTSISLSWGGAEAFDVADASALAAVESAASANAAELVAMNMSAAAPQDAARAITLPEYFGICSICGGRTTVRPNFRGIDDSPGKSTYTACDRVRLILTAPELPLVTGRRGSRACENAKYEAP